MDTGSNKSFSTYDLLTIGDAKIDIFLTLHDSGDKYRIDDSGNLCIVHGQKINVEHANILVGGNAANVSVGVARLGLKTAIAAEIGDDEFSIKILNTLAQEHVDRVFIKQGKGQPSSLSVIINFAGDRTVFGKHVMREHDFLYEHGEFAWIYLTSLGERWDGAYTKAIDRVSNKTRLAFNPGTKQLAEKSDIMKEVLKKTSVLFVSLEEGFQLLEQYGDSYKEDNKKEVLKRLKELGPVHIVITDGKNGSFAIDQDGQYFECPIIPCSVVEKTGAGDSFAAGFLSGVIYNKSVPDAMKWGTCNSASVIGKIGAQAGLLKKEEMEAQTK